MNFVNSALTPHLSVRVINPTKGRGLFAEKDFEANDVVLVDKSLIAMQHVKNRMVAITCANCFRFLGSLEYQLAHLTKFCSMKPVSKSFRFPAIPGVPQEQDPFFTTQIVDCPGNCGEKYCSNECQQQAFSQHHQLLCVGPINDHFHPLVLFKKYAIENNEIFLLAAQMIVRIILHYRNTGSREGTDILSMFQHKAWWDVVIPDHNEEFSQELEADLRKILAESLHLLTQAILHPILAQYPNAQIQDLFTMDFYSHLIGMLEMYDNTIEIKSPLQKYLDNLKNLPVAQHEPLKAILLPLQDKLAIMLEEEECDEEDEDHDEHNNEDAGHDNSVDDEAMEDDVEPEELEFPKFDGLGVFPTSAMSNHSCDPNCIVKYGSDNSLLFVSKRKILKGEELTHSYIDDDLNLSARRKNLREYGFWCDCPKCEKEEAEEKAT
eukprot:Phypoly_transcript_06433.p1 GENE.Phypoly_transcript_06433~~Phypoly_transcript_06433.p1  ORF type:complete len:455 (+),score=67.98 Phypoly_transcript_06433:59-1366(+)